MVTHTSQMQLGISFKLFDCDALPKTLSTFLLYGITELTGVSSKVAIIGNLLFLISYDDGLSKQSV